MLNKNAKRIAFVSGLGFAALVSSLVVPTICSANNANAEVGEPVASETSLTISSTNDQALLTVTPVSDAKSFGVSDADGTAAFSVTTNNYTGYTLGIAASDDEGKLTNVDLADNSTHYLYSIASSLNASAFNNATYTNKWGFRPNKYVDNNVVVNNTGEYAVFLPAPTTTPTILDHTSVANENANDYTIALGARVDGSTYPGSYTSTMNLIALANVVNYTISFDKNTDDDVMNMPATIGSATADTSITLPSNTPERAYHLFRGWCTVETTNTQCSGNTFQPGDEFGINQTSTNSTTLYAIWEPKPYMQDYDYGRLLELLPNVNDSATLYDKRDEKTYTVARISDGNIWMTTNLDLAGGTEVTPALSNVASNYTLPASSQTGFDNDTDDFVFNSGNNDCSGSEPCYSYYSHIAATAGMNLDNGDTPYDICPKGWRMPTKKEMETLTTIYPTVTELHESVFDAQFTGYMIGNNFYNGQNVTEYWSSTAIKLTAVNTQGAYYLYVYTSNQKTSIMRMNKRYGISVRCISKVEYIQDYDQDELYAALPNAGDTIELYDKRDNQKYTLGKLADGNIWMLDNLRLDLISVSEAKLSGNTNASGETIAYLKGISARDVETNPNGYYATSGVSNNWSDLSYSDPRIDTSKANENAFDGYRIGTYYNYCAATAGSYCFGEGLDMGNPSGNATEDICPKGWRMPTGGNDSEASALAAAYQNNKAALAEAAHLPLSGFQNGSPASINSNGGFWNSSFQNTWNMKTLYLGTENITLSFSDRKMGFTVRCVYDKKTYLQDMDEEKLNALVPNAGDMAVLYDKRDNQGYTIGKLADGNYWLLDNLALDLTDENVQEKLTSATTNASETTLGHFKNGSGVYYDQYATASAANWGSSDSYAKPLIYTASKDTTGSGGYEAGKYGIYYNYCAASAGSYCYSDGNLGYGTSSGDATEDICPKGWRMPTGGQYGEYNLLIKEYDSSYTDFIDALHIPLSGRIQNGAENNQSKYGYFWSSTRQNDNLMFALTADEHALATIPAKVTISTYGRNIGNSVRCIFNISKTYMQDMTNSSLAALLPNAGDTTTLYDKRDNQKYTVGKLADGNYWMLDNLRLNLVDVSLDRLKGDTNASDASLEYLKNGGGTASDQYAMTGVANWASSFPYSAPLIDASATSVVPENGYPGKTGIFYNYCAASAGSYCYGNGTSAGTSSGDATEDICPKGWRMPTGGGDGENGEYETLYYLYTDSQQNYQPFINAFHMPLTGYPVGNGNIYGQGSNGNIWSSTRKNDTGNYQMTINNNLGSPTNALRRDNGFSVRCVFDSLKFMQDATSSNLAELAPNVGDTIDLYDKRDGEKYTIGKMADGKYWLLENLRLDPVTVPLDKLEGNTNASDTSLAYLKGVSTGTASDKYPTAAATDTWNSNSYSKPQVYTAAKNSVPEAGYQGKQGVYYNYCAASAGSYCYGDGDNVVNPPADAINVTEDICPAGWHMPTGGSPNGDFYTLFHNHYGNDEHDVTTATNYKNDLRITYAGVYYIASGETTASVTRLGEHANIWSSTRLSTNQSGQILDLYAINGSEANPVNTATYGKRFMGYSVRCLFDN